MSDFLFSMFEAKSDKLIPIIKGNPNQRELMKLCRMIGVEVRMSGKTEILLSHPSQGTKPIILSSSRRKDTPWGVIDWLNRVIKATNAEKVAKMVMTVKSPGLGEGIKFNRVLAEYSSPVGKRINYPDGSYKITNGIFCNYYDSNGKSHREGGPAIINLRNKYYAYYNHGRLHRLDGPAVTNYAGEFYYVHGKKFTKEDFYDHFGDD